MYAEGYPVTEICKITGCNRTSLMEWCLKYKQRGAEGLVDHRGGPRRAKLTPEQTEDVAIKLQQYRPYDLLGPGANSSSGEHWTVEDLSAVMRKWYGVSWKSRSSYHSLLAQSGFSYQRTEKVFKSRRERDVMSFEEQVEKN